MFSFRASIYIVPAMLGRCRHVAQVVTCICIIGCDCLCCASCGALCYIFSYISLCMAYCPLGHCVGFHTSSVLELCDSCWQAGMVIWRCSCVSESFQVVWQPVWIRASFTSSLLPELRYMQAGMAVTPLSQHPDAFPCAASVFPVPAHATSACERCAELRIVMHPMCHAAVGCKQKPAIIHVHMLCHITGLHSPHIDS